MKKKVSIVLIVFVVAAIVVFCVAQKDTKKIPMPDFADFSDTELEERENKLPELDKAILYLDGKQQEILKDDNRLIRLLNFCTYAFDGGMSMWTVATDYNYHKVEIENGNRLEVFFKNVESTGIGWEFELYDKFVIKENRVWLIQSNPLYDLPHEGNTFGVSIWYPYAGKCEGIDNMDFLVEAGFVN